MALKINDNGVTRNMTTDEQAAHEAWQAEVATQTVAQAEAVAEKASARAALLTKLGITEAEAQLLLGS